MLCGSPCRQIGDALKATPLLVGIPKETVEHLEIVESLEIAISLVFSLPCDWACGAPTKIESVCCGSIGSYRASGRITIGEANRGDR